MALQAPVTLRASMGRSAMMTGARTCVKMLNPAVNQTTLPYGMTRMGLNPAEERQRGRGKDNQERWKSRKVKFVNGEMRKDQRKTQGES